MPEKRAIVHSTATVTFLFTDIEGSTRLWEQDPDAMRAALARHDTLLRHGIEARGGHVFKTVGDAFCGVFAAASQAVVAALAIQQALCHEPFVECVLRVRMAVQTGAAEEREGDYFGPTLNRVARLLAIGHGSQVLLSAATQGFLDGALPAGASLVDWARTGSGTSRNRSASINSSTRICRIPSPP